MSPSLLIEGFFAEARYFAANAPGLSEQKMGWLLTQVDLDVFSTLVCGAHV